MMKGAHLVKGLATRNAVPRTPVESAAPGEFLGKSRKLPTPVSRQH
jgi:hypothetical protein